MAEFKIIALVFRIATKAFPGKAGGFKCPGAVVCL
jgi:hypothetical protein